MTNLTTAPPHADRLTDRERAISTLGVDDAAETLAACGPLAELVTRTLTEQPGVTWAQRRAAGPLADVPRSPRARTVQIGGVPVRRIEPLGAVRGTYVHVHGGGWVLGTHEGQDERLVALADAAGARVLSVGYRLAPEHPFPAAVDDVVTVLRSPARDGGPVVVGGESAGAHLTALALLRARDEGLPPAAGAVLTYGAYDLAGTPSRRHDPRGFTTTELLLPHVPPAERRRPDLSPLYADLDGMPPARLLVGTRDSLVDDSLMLAARWQQVAPVELDVVAGACHGFTLLDLAVSRRAREAEHAFVRRMLAR